MSVDDRLQHRLSVKAKLQSRVQTMKQACMALERIAHHLNLKDGQYPEDVFTFLRECRIYHEALTEYHRTIMYARNLGIDGSDDNT